MVVLVLDFSQSSPPDIDSSTERGTVDVYSNEVSAIQV